MMMRSANSCAPSPSSGESWKAADYRFDIAPVLSLCKDPLSEFSDTCRRKIRNIQVGESGLEKSPSELWVNTK